MSRAQRLLDLLQLLRRYRKPVTGPALARELDISLRTLYRDIESLKARGAPIDGEPGIGYVLRPGFLLPPLMLTEEEIEALALGARWVSERGDGALAHAARNLIAKVGAVLPADLKQGLHNAGLLIGPGVPLAAGDTELISIRRAIRSEQKLRIDYADEQGRTTKRTIWPVALAFFDRVRVVVGWCELRAGFRHFRCDRIILIELLAERYPRRRLTLFKEWREQQGVAEQ